MFTAWKTLLAVACVAGLGLTANLLAQNAAETKPEPTEAISFEPVLKELAIQLSKYMDERGADKEVAIKQFNAPPAVTGAQNLREIMEKLLVEQNVKVVDELDSPQWTVVGNLSITGGDNSKASVLKVTVFDANGAELHEFNRLFDQNPVVAEPRDNFNEQQKRQGAPEVPSGAVSTDATETGQLFQRNVDFQQAVEKSTGKSNTAVVPTQQVNVNSQDARSAREAQQAALAASFDSRTASNFARFPVKGGEVIAASSSSPFRIRVRATRDTSNENPTDADYLPLAIQQKGVGAFTELQLNQFFCVDVLNMSEQTVGVELQLDGINALDQCEIDDWRQGGKLVLGPKSMITIPGWMINSGSYALFKTVPEADSEAIKSGRPQKLGVITATFFTARRENEPAPLFDKLLASAATRGDGIAVGKGPLVSKDAAESVRLIFGEQALALVSLRYREVEETPKDLPPQ